MEAIKLMIGDYVKYQGFICRIEEISAQGWVHLIYPDTGIRVNIISDYIMHLLEPVPLTSKILELNDFNKLSNGLYSYDIEHEFNVVVFFLPIVKEDESKIVININCLSSLKDGSNLLHSCDINYVHEFQHALHLCKLNEFANNFKVIE